MNDLLDHEGPLSLIEDWPSMVPILTMPATRVVEPEAEPWEDWAVWGLALLAMGGFLLVLTLGWA